MLYRDDAKADFSLGILFDDPSNGAFKAMLKGLVIQEHIRVLELKIEAILKVDQSLHHVLKLRVPAKDNNSSALSNSVKSPVAGLPGSMHMFGKVVPMLCY